ncbi:hypothetical protein [Candidatus Nitrososphaera evergladensis]|uniref:hypothetical protein n=1 Tax=Candidatus Nitrososphaera evergladensis TaxID=1459637 RepID=UPI0011E595A1|nr:hypothetical protein [Candidatus Nitrososphaera evergladensis]
MADEILEPDGQHIEFPFMLEKWISAWKEGFRHSAAPYEWRPLESMHRETGDFLRSFLRVTIMAKVGSLPRGH